MSGRTIESLEASEAMRKEIERLRAELAERDALARDLTTIVRMPNVEYVADRHNRAVELLRLKALPKEPKP